MIAAPLPADEARRQAALDALDILDTEPEAAFDDLVALAAQVCGVPVGLVSLVDRDRQWFKARLGLDACETPREVSFCAHAILVPERPLVVPDALADPRFADNPLVTGPTQVRFYAGVPLRTDDGAALGTLCVIDHRPRSPDAAQLSALEAIARQVVSQLLLRQALAQQARACKALRDAARQTERARDLAEQSARMRSDFIANISHELRTPLQVILGFAELGATRPAAADVAARLFTDIGRAGGQMLALVNDLLDLAKLEAAGSAIRRVEADVAAVVRGAVQDLHPLAEHRDLEIALAGASAPLPGSVDTFRFAQVLRNVLANAIRLAPVASTIEVELLQRGGEAIEVHVADRGPGIPEADLERIFDAFEQSSTTRDGAGGTGLGLTICRRIMAAHGGSIVAANREGGGAVFRIRLPGASTQKG